MDDESSEQVPAEGTRSDLGPGRDAILSSLSKNPSPKDLDMTGGLAIHPSKAKAAKRLMDEDVAVAENAKDTNGQEGRWSDTSSSQLYGMRHREACKVLKMRQLGTRFIRTNAVSSPDRLRGIGPSACGQYS